MPSLRVDKRAKNPVKIWRARIKSAEYGEFYLGTFKSEREAEEMERAFRERHAFPSYPRRSSRSRQSS